MQPQAMLEAVGITEAEEAVYRALLSYGKATASDLAGSSGIPASRIRKALGALEDKGLVSRLPGRAHLFLAAPPEAAVQVLILRRHEELERARRSALDLQKQYRTAAGRDPEELVEVISGREAVAHRYRQLLWTAKQEVLTFDRPPYATTPTAPNPIIIERLAEGIRFRAIYDGAALSVPGRMKMIEETATAGEESRVLEQLPMKLVVVDEHHALLPLSMEEPGVDQSAVLVHASSLLQALRTLFETLWTHASALPFGSDGAGTAEGDVLPATDRQILSLLTAGLKDEAIAHQLGIGVRTVRRRIAELMSTLAVTTRFQAGLQAAKRGWL